MGWKMNGVPLRMKCSATMGRRRCSRRQNHERQARRRSSLARSPRLRPVGNRQRQSRCSRSNRLSQRRQIFRSLAERALALPRRRRPAWAAVRLCRRVHGAGDHALSNGRPSALAQAPARRPHACSVLLRFACSSVPAGGCPRRLTTCHGCTGELTALYLRPLPWTGGHHGSQIRPQKPATLLRVEVPRNNEGAPDPTDTARARLVRARAHTAFLVGHMFCNCAVYMWINWTLASAR